MKYIPFEPYANWLDRSSQFENDIAMKQIVLDQDQAMILEKFSRRFLNKALHPVICSMREHYSVDFDNEKSRNDYYEQYLKNRTSVADHIDDNLFDNTGKT